MKQLSEENKHCGLDVGNAEVLDLSARYEMTLSNLNDAKKRIDELETELFNAESKSYNETENKLVKLEDKIDELEKEKIDWRYRALNAEKVIGELTTENAELKANHNEILGRIKSVSGARVFHLHDEPQVGSHELNNLLDVLGIDFLAEQSLAQHDKEVAVKALMDFRKYLDEQGFKSVQKSVINKYAEQLQEQE